MSATATILTRIRCASTKAASTKRRIYPEIAVFAALLCLFNLHVLGIDAAPQAYFSDRVAEGEWWRILTHPLVHISWYHLLLDGLAFLILYASLATKSGARRLLYVGASNAGSLGLSLLLSPQINDLGLCGLSGAAHGLMAISALEMITQKTPDRQLATIGWISLAMVFGKSFFELVTGHVLFEFLQFGMTGTPIAVSHMGGVLAGMGVFIAMGRVRRGRSTQGKSLSTCDSQHCSLAPRKTPPVQRLEYRVTTRPANGLPARSPVDPPAVQLWAAIRGWTHRRRMMQLPRITSRRSVRAPQQ